MESVFNMLRPLHFVLLLAAFAFLAFVAAEDGPAEHQFEPQPNADVNDLETDASSYGNGGWGYGRPWGYGGNYGRGWNGWRGGYGWGGRGYGRGWGWGGYWG